MKITCFPEVTISLFKTDLEAGSGNELENKFKAVHSSSALVINCFAPWKKRPQDLIIDGIKGFDRITFEKQCPTGLGGTPPNLDLVLENKSQVMGVESKFTEYLTPKKPQFAASYNKNNLPQAENKPSQEIRRPGGSGFSCRRAQEVQEAAGTSEAARRAAENERHRGAGALPPVIAYG